MAVGKAHNGDRGSGRLMRFLRRRTPAELTTTQPTEEAVAAELDPVAVLTGEGITDGWIEPTEMRLSDLLNAGMALTIRVADDAGQPGPAASFMPDETIAVAAPPRRGRSPHRMARRRHASELRADPYVIHGTLHMPPGADPARYAASTGQRWLPVSNCLVGAPDGDFEVEVLIVNLDLRRVTT